MNDYLSLKNKHEKEFNEFPMVFAFNDEQFKEGMKSLGLKITDTDKVYRGIAGGFYKKTDSKRLKDLLKKHATEMKEAIMADTTGEGFIYDMFNYELANHEYCVTMSIESTIDALGLTIEERVLCRPVGACLCERFCSGGFTPGYCIANLRF